MRRGGIAGIAVKRFGCWGWGGGASAESPRPGLLDGCAIRGGGASGGAGHPTQGMRNRPARGVGAASGVSPATGLGNGRAFIGGHTCARMCAGGRYGGGVGTRTQALPNLVPPRPRWRGGVVGARASAGVRDRERGGGAAMIDPRRLRTCVGRARPQRRRRRVLRLLLIIRWPLDTRRGLLGSLPWGPHPPSASPPDPSVYAADDEGVASDER